MYQSNSTPSLYTHNAHVQCTVQRSVLTYGLAALLLLCSSVTSPALAQGQGPVMQAMVQIAPEWMYIQITTFNDGKREMFIDEDKYSYEVCQKKRDERQGMWDVFGDHDYVRSVVYLCLPKRKLI